MTYYNTNELEGEALKKANQNTAGQEAIVLEFFERLPSMRFSPERIHKAVLPHVPLTSVRRAITNLTKKGLLRKTKQMTLGDYGTQVHTWQLNWEEGRTKPITRTKPGEAKPVQMELF